MNNPADLGLYRPSFEHDSCGFGLTAQMDGRYSHELVNIACTALERLAHRGAIGGDGKSGDGCGLLLKLSPRFWRDIAEELGWELPQQFAIGMVFLSTDNKKATKGRKALEKALVEQGLQVVGWRDVPTDPSVLGSIAADGLPLIEQVFIGSDGDLDEPSFGRALFMARRLAEKAMAADEEFYIPSLSSKVVSYKGMMLPKFMQTFYLDLLDERMEASLAVFHQRFSTNTLPSWKLAQPFRYLAHNGEINTIQGNRNWSRARTSKLETPLIPQIKEIEPIVAQSGSDSSSLDNMLEVLLVGGVDIFRALAMLIPPAWQNVEGMDSDLRAFHRYNSMHMEPWDGPAGIVLTDGRYAVCKMDRNGLRPARYSITQDRVITLASEAGVVDSDPAQVISRGRLKPGQMIAVDTKNGTLLFPQDIDQRLKAAQPYKRWLKRHEQHLISQLDYQLPDPITYSPAYLKILQKAFQFTYEEVETIIKTLAKNGAEAVGSMGDDAPFAVLSKLVRSPYDYFRQQFAQVTNPPIDPLRESMVMSLEVCLGREHNVFTETPEHAARVVIDSPIVSTTKFQQVLAINDPRFGHHRIELIIKDDETLNEAIDRICSECENAVLEGAVFLVLSDANLDRDQVPVHALLATGAIHHYLIQKGIRCDANILVETATARDPHQVATLIGYGATAVIPWLAYETIRQMVRDGAIKSKETQALRAYRKGLNKGLYKIMSKMGISTVASYRGAQLFESVGLGDEVVDKCFVGTVNRIGGSNFADLEADQRQLIARAWDVKADIEHPGLLKYVHEGEYHAYNPDVIGAIHEAVETGSYDEYKKFRDLVNNRPATVLRDLLELKTPKKGIDIDEVEPLEDIMLRFDSAGMSLGALSPEAHEALAMAMNSIGGRSNSGEGGEDPARYGTDKMSKIKQVASGRFGVTPAYLVNAEVLQIKVAQGAKPGEGGQLPGDKVNQMIATLRYSMPGVALISPPPHHDIYSIEDLAQLIFDLKQVNPKALVSVKLVSEAGVGTIAAGVVKASADLITISGYDGGTGASPLTSVKYCGGPWEMGLVETQQVLRANQLRNKVRLQADGGLKTGLDVIKAAILGAESFGFGTLPMVALGCKYLRICHLNNCATGIATQHATLRKRHFKGSPERVVNYFKFVAQEVRELMAELGVRSMDELIGRTDLLEPLKGETERQHRLDLTSILSDGGVASDVARMCEIERNEPSDPATLGKRMVADMKSAIKNSKGGEFEYEVFNTDRSVGTRVSGEIARLHGNQGMADSPIEVTLRGTVGQSFAAFNAGGLNLKLIGEANDYVGKGMAGGTVSIRSFEQSRLRSNECPIIGNTCLYGATGGQLFAAGTAGERFAVRNSGAIAVVEGMGDHGCEYMTGGAVVVLGKVGQNFGAGMTGGMAFVLDEDRSFVDLYNHELIDITRLTQESMEMHLAFMERLLDQHVQATDSKWAIKIREEMMDYAGKFWLVTPKAVDLSQLLGTLLAAA